MRLSSSVLCLLAILCVPSSASAQARLSLPDLEAQCGRGVLEACFAFRFGRCAHEEPRIAIPACTRQLLNRDSAWNNRPDTSLIQRDRATRYSLRATARAKQGDVDRALADYDRAIKAYDDFHWIHALRGSTLFAAGEEQEALASINEAVSLAPNDALVINARARLYSTALDENVRNGPQAIADAQRAMVLEPGRSAYIAALATAYAENGAFENAVNTQKRAIDLLDPGDQGTIASYTSRLELYQEGKPFRREMITCGEIEESSGPDTAVSNSIFSPLVFCFADGEAVPR